MRSAALAIAGTGVLFAAAVPPIGIAPLSVVALVPMILVARAAPTWRSALLRGMAASFAVTLAVFHWLPGSVHAFFDLPVAASWLVFPLYALIAQPQLIGWALVRWLVRGHRGLPVALASAAAYTGLDWLLPKLFRDTLGVAFVGDGLAIQIVDLGGVYLLTFVIVLTGEALYQAHRRDRPALSTAILAVAAWAAIFVYGDVRRAQVEDASEAAPILRAGVVQANIGNVEKEMALRGDLEGIVGTLRRYGELSDQLAKAAQPPDLLLWPETAYPLAYGAHRSSTDDDIDHELATYVHERKLPLLFGGYDRADGVEFNSALLLTPSGEAAVYHKRILIPFGEYIPLLGRARFGTGGTPRTLALRHHGRTTAIALIICYESLFTAHAADAVADGAQLLANLTNDSWFVSSAEKQLHLAMAALRSLETRRAQVRATNTGISALILPSGAIVEPTDEDAAVARIYSAPLLELPPTLVMQLGNWPGPASLLLLAGLLVWLRRRAA